ncbi:MAG TPA: hypothetical protein PLZ56_06045, partial [Anaerolineae bacterium]|nr:hypothetical protein [Anaerolineae bacterium]
ILINIDLFVALIRAIAYSGLPDWRELLESVAERMPARRVLMDRFFTGKEPLLFAVALQISAQL